MSNYPNSGDQTHDQEAAALLESAEKEFLLSVFFLLIYFLNKFIYFFIAKHHLLAYRVQVPHSKTASLKGTRKQKISNNQKQSYTFKVFLKALILLQNTMSAGKEFHAQTELIRMN